MPLGKVEEEVYCRCEGEQAQDRDIWKSPESESEPHRDRGERRRESGQ